MVNVLTNLDEIVNYPDKIAYLLSQDKKIVGLLLDNPEIDMNDINTDIIGSQIFNYNFIPDVLKDSLSYITIDTVVSSIKNDKTKMVNVIITVISNKSNIKLDTSRFKELSGNRRDNLVRYIDLVVRNIKSNDLGIGKLQFVSRNPVYPISIGSNDYTAKQLVYEIANFDGRIK